jgi:GrpB-like predicted nucleotidyltransferase (UPF0157 family)
MAKAIAFDTTVTTTGNNTGIVVPAELIEQLGAGKRPAVLVSVNGYEYRNTVGVMGGKFMLPISAAVRKVTGLKGGEPIHVILSITNESREVNMPADFQDLLAAEPALAQFFSGLSNSLQRYHVDNINAAKNADTRQRRIEKSIALFREGKQR